MENDYVKPYGLTVGEMALELAELEYFALRVCEILDRVEDHSMPIDQAMDRVYREIVENYQALDSDRIIQLYTRAFVA